MRGRSRKALALLASGVVLVGGAVTTLAAWQDTEYVGLPLTLSQFDLQTSFDDAQWNDASTATSPTSLVVALSGALSSVKLTPNGSVTAWVGLRTAPKSMAATVTMSNLSIGAGANDLGLLSALTSSGDPAVTYDATANVPRADCQSGTYTGTAMASNLALGAAVSSTSSTFPVPAGVGGAAGSTVGVCFRIKLADGVSSTLGGAQISPVWKFSATSATS